MKKLNTSITQKNKPTRKKRNIEEFRLQCQCVEWFRLQYPNEIIFAIPNGGARGLIEAVNFKRMGVLAGIPDLFIARGNSTYNGMVIEMKASKGKLSISQEELQGALTLKGYAYAVCKDLEEFMREINIYYYKPKVL